jgi:hypothetical protein
MDSSEERIASGTEATVITVETPPSHIEGQLAIFARTGGIASADRVASPHYFEDAMLFTSFCARDANFCCAQQTGMHRMDGSICLIVYLPESRADTYRCKKFHRPGVL